MCPRWATLEAAKRCLLALLLLFCHRGTCPPHRGTCRSDDVIDVHRPPHTLPPTQGAPVERCLLALSFVFLVIGVVLTAVGFAARPRDTPTPHSGYLALQVRAVCAQLIGIDRSATIGQKCQYTATATAR